MYDLEKHKYKDHVELLLDKETSPQEILAQLINMRVSINRFEVSTPSLDEIFLQVVGKEK